LLIFSQKHLHPKLKRTGSNHHKIKYQTMATMQAITENSTFTPPLGKMSTSGMKPVLHTPFNALPSSGLTSRTSRRESLLHVPSDALPSAGLDFLLQIHVRRTKTDKKAQKMTKKERTMIREGAWKERTMLIEEASKIIGGDESIM
jgi:hypothetical protein